MGTTTVSGVLYWLSKDPIGLSGGLNLYVYCSNDPVNRRDPFGLCEDGEKYVQDYTDALRRDWWILYTGAFYMPIWSQHPSRDIRNQDQMYEWRGFTFTSAQMGNAGAGYALSEVYGPGIASMVVVGAETFYAVFDDNWHWTDALGSFIANGIGIYQSVHD